MVLKLRVRLGRSGGGRRARQLASKAAVLLTPAALVALILASWRLGADLGWAGDFAIPDGLFSHWQVWMVVAAALQVSASALNRYGTRGQAPKARVTGSPRRLPPARRPQATGATHMPQPIWRIQPEMKPDSRTKPVRRLPETYPVKDRTYF